MTVDAIDDLRLAAAIVIRAAAPRLTHAVSIHAAAPRLTHISDHFAHVVPRLTYTVTLANRASAQMSVGVFLDDLRIPL